MKSRNDMSKPLVAHRATWLGTSVVGAPSVDAIRIKQFSGERLAP